jgi:hypothetical protein
LPHRTITPDSLSRDRIALRIGMKVCDRNAKKNAPPVVLMRDPAPANCRFNVRLPSKRQENVLQRVRALALFGFVYA